MSAPSRPHSLHAPVNHPADTFDGLMVSVPRIFPEPPRVASSSQPADTYTYTSNGYRVLKPASCHAPLATGPRGTHRSQHVSQHVSRQPSMPAKAWQTLRPESAFTDGGAPEPASETSLLKPSGHGEDGAITTNDCDPQGMCMGVCCTTWLLGQLSQKVLCNDSSVCAPVAGYGLCVTLLGIVVIVLRSTVWSACDGEERRVVGEVATGDDAKNCFTLAYMENVYHVLTMFMAVLAGCLVYALRQKTRRRDGMVHDCGSVCEDAACACFCVPCATCQLARHEKFNSPAYDCCSTTGV